MGFPAELYQELENKVTGTEHYADTKPTVKIFGQEVHFYLSRK